jgi:voltage-gated potassium channel
MSIIERSFNRFRKDPASVRRSTVAIMSATVIVVVVGAVFVRIFDREEYPTFGGALWFTLQTVTTVGYGDTTPERIVGRAVAAVVMITAIGLITVVTAAITSVFIEAARSERATSRRNEDTEILKRLAVSLEEIGTRLDQLETTHADTTAGPEEAESGLG